jgi:hypothetical protein
LQTDQHAGERSREIRKRIGKYRVPALHVVVQIAVGTDQQFLNLRRKPLDDMIDQRLALVA